jgi:hypothetical protein
MIAPLAPAARCPRAFVLLSLLAGGPALSGCGGPCEDTESEVQVTLTGPDGNPIVGSVAWSHEDGESGSLSCAGACAFQPADEGTVTVTCTPDDAALGEPVAETTTFAMAQDAKCEEPVYTMVACQF